MCQGFSGRQTNYHLQCHCGSNEQFDSLESVSVDKDRHKLTSVSMEIGQLKLSSQVPLLSVSSLKMCHVFNATVLRYRDWYQVVSFVCLICYQHRLEQFLFIVIQGFNSQLVDPSNFQSIFQIFIQLGSPPLRMLKSVNLLQIASLSSTSCWRVITSYSFDSMRIHFSVYCFNF